MKLLLALLLAPAVLAAEVSGYVYTPDGSVVEGAVVRAGTTSATTGKDGGFVLRDVPEGVIELEAGAKELPSVKRLVLTGDLVSITLTDIDSSPSPYPSPRERGEGTDFRVTGKVTLDGKPLANAPVIVGGTHVTTNAKGEYVATGLSSERPLITIDERLIPRVRMPREARVDLPLRSAPMIRGRVVDAEGKPVARARVHLGHANGTAMDFAFNPSPVRTTPDGRYALPVPAEMDKALINVAVRPRLHSTVRSKAFLSEAAGRTVDVTLPEHAAVRIRAVDRAGKPIPKARIAFVSSAESAPFATARDLLQPSMGAEASVEAEQGEAVVQLAPDTYDFAAVADGFRAGSSSKSIAKAGTVDVRLQPEALLRGRVHRGGQGVAYVTVDIGPADPVERTLTDEDGKFEFKGLAPGPYRLTFSTRPEMVERTMEAEAPGNLDVELPPGGNLRIRVLDSAKGTALPEFSYVLENLEEEPSNTTSNGTSADGTHAIQVPAGNYRITARAQGFAPSDWLEVHVTDGDTADVDVHLNRGATVTGRVLDERGQPLGAANVWLTIPEKDRRRPSFGPAHMTTSADGTFTSAVMTPGDMRLVVEKDGYLSQEKTLQVEEATSVEVTLARGLAVHGIVLRGGKPVAGAQVDASSRAVGAEPQSAVSDVQGRFTLTGLIAARYTVDAVLDEERARASDVDPSAQKDIVLSLGEKAHGVIHGTVSGVPASAGRRTVFVSNGEEQANGVIDPAGRYRIEDAPLGNVMVLAVIEASPDSMRSSQRKQVEVLAGEPLRVDFDLGVAIKVSGRVTAGGEPVAATVGFGGDDGNRASTRTRDDGAFEIELTAPGRYSVMASAHHSGERQFTSVRDIRGGEIIDIDLSEKVFEGTVVDAQTRHPIAGARVVISGPSLSSLPAADVATTASGTFRVAAAASGPLRLMISSHGYAQVVIPLGGPTLPSVFELSPAPETRIRVLDGKTGTPLEAEVGFLDDGGPLSVIPRRSADGTTYLFTVAPGRYRVLAYVRGYEMKTVEMTAPGVLDIVIE